MGCGSCGGAGCSTGGCGRNGGCATGGCNKLNTFDWLRNMLPPDRTEVDNIYEVRFKNTRKSFFRNVNGLRIYAGDLVVVESDRGFDVGVIGLGGVMAELQMKKKGFKKNRDEVPRIYRKANEDDEALIKELRKKEPRLVARAREIVRDLKLDMKLSDIEYQGDGTKAIFYYIADHRVDFRELIKLLAREFHIRIEMKQIGLRHEAGLIGGIGACGRELCCSTWLTDFKTVSTSAARYQNLSLNPMKISGLCGRLKCCLNFELDSYMDALQGFPKIDKLKTAKGVAFLQKTDIFKGIMWFSYPDETSWYPLEVEEVKRIREENKEGKSPESLAAYVEAKKLAEAEKSFDFVDVVGTELPELPERGSQRRRRKKGKRGPKPQGKKPQSPQSKGGASKTSQAKGNKPAGQPQGSDKPAGQDANRGKSRSSSNRRRGQGGAKQGGQASPKNKQGGNQGTTKPQTPKKPRPQRSRGKGPNSPANQGGGAASPGTPPKSGNEGKTNNRNASRRNRGRKGPRGNKPPSNTPKS